MAEINLSNESTISTNISTDTPITTNVPDINYIPGYKVAEEERRANEVIRQENEQGRVALYEDMENKLETGYFNGRDGVIQYTAGTGIDITDNVISSTHTSAVWGNIGGDLTDQTDLASALNNKADSSSIPTKTSDLQNDSNFVESSSLSTVATSGSYTDLSNTPTIPDELKDLTDDSTHRLVTDTEKTTWSEKQDALVSGTNIKTINNTSLLGSGNITVSADDEIAVSTTQPTGNETLWINPNEAPSGSLNPISNTYGVAQDKGYSQEYLNGKLEEIGEIIWMNNTGGGTFAGKNIDASLSEYSKFKIYYYVDTNMSRILSITGNKGDNISCTYTTNYRRTIVLSDTRITIGDGYYVNDMNNNAIIPAYIIGYK